MNKRLFANNQHAENVIKHMKEMPDLHHHIQEPATYMWWWWKNALKCGKTLVRDYNMMPHTIATRKQVWLEKMQG